jgi:abortive infection bacteriophage resistance protein
MKPHLTYEQQLKLITDRGLIVEDSDAFMSLLREKNYYRIRGYFHPFLAESKGKTKPVFKSGTKGNTIIELVEFDGNLRGLLFEALSAFEVKFRSILAYHAGEDHPAIHLNGVGLTHAPTSPEFKDWKEKYLVRIHRHSKNPIVVAHNLEHGGILPIWVAVEILDFGNISWLYGAFDENLASKIAREFSLKAQFMKDAVASLNHLRNHVVHQSRIWNYQYSVSPPSEISLLPSDLGHLSDRRNSEDGNLAARLSLLLWFDKNDGLKIDFTDRLFNILRALPKSAWISMSSMGYNSRYDASPLWSRFKPTNGI